MAGLRELRKRLGSIRTIRQLAAAMRTAASAKYARASSALAGYKVYDAACNEMFLRSFCADILRSAPAQEAPDCFVVLSGNRGLCGGYNTVLLNFFSELYGAQPQPPLVIACGKTAAAYCRDKNIALLEVFPFSDIPSYAETQKLAAYVRSLYTSGKAAHIIFIYQKFSNMLTQKPARRCVLPPDEAETIEAAGKETLLLPDRETVCERLSQLCFDSSVYSIALEGATGAQAATLMAMRSAYDNASESAEKLETAINRRRQNEVTASVIETASDNIQ